LSNFMTDLSKGNQQQKAKIGIVTISDRASAGVYEDISGRAIIDSFTDYLTSPWQAEYRLIPDEKDLIEKTLCELVVQVGCALIVITGGTGPAICDITL